jgi:uncharacterized protein (DUF58 family)
MIPKALMEELRYIEIYTRRAVRDHRVGDYRSPLRGRGFEFDEHKRYQEGDDYRQIDWNATARMGQPFIKKDFEEKELSAVIIADLSRSMEFANVDESKRELLLKVAAVLAFSACSDNMKVGLVGFTDKIELDLPLKKGSAQTWKIVESLWNIKPRSIKTDFSLPFEFLAGRLKTSTLLFLLSDFIQAEETFHSHALRHLARKHDLIPVIIQDTWEEALPAGKGFLRLRDAETGGTMVFNLTGKKRSFYKSMMQERKTALERALYNLKLDHLFLHAGQPYLEPVIGFFLARKNRK